MEELAELSADARKVALDRFRLLRPHLEESRSLQSVALAAGLPVRRTARDRQRRHRRRRQIQVRQHQRRVVRRDARTEALSHIPGQQRDRARGQGRRVHRLREHPRDLTVQSHPRLPARRRHRHHRRSRRVHGPRRREGRIRGTAVIARKILRIRAVHHLHMHRRTARQRRQRRERHHRPVLTNLNLPASTVGTYVLDGLLYHESDLRIEEHYTDTAGFTDHVFALMHMLGFRFAPRLRYLGETRLYVPKQSPAYTALKPMIGGTLQIKSIRAHWDEVLRLATSIKQGTVTASLVLRKLGSYPRQNGLAVALRELGRIERTLFILDWLQSVELRRRVHTGLNKGEARNALARAVFFYRLGEIRDRSFEQQQYRASGLTLATAAIALWNTVYLERASNALRENGHPVDPALRKHLSPLGWEHINLTGDYQWRNTARLGRSKFRPLRQP